MTEQTHYCVKCGSLSEFRWYRGYFALSCCSGLFFFGKRRGIDLRGVGSRKLPDENGY